MKQLFGVGALSIAPCNRGFVFAETHKNLQNGEVKNLIAFNQHNFDSGDTTAITKTAYLNNIFKNHSDFLKEEISDYISIITAFTPNLGTIILKPSGIATVFDYNCNYKFKSNLKYKGYAPSDAVVHGESLWCAYPDSNTIIKYNANSLRQEFKISSGVEEELTEPYSLFALDDGIVVTSQSCGNVKKVMYDDYKIETLYEFDEPVKKYIKVDSNEVILTKSGIYKL